MGTKQVDWIDWVDFLLVFFSRYLKKWYFLLNLRLSRAPFWAHQLLNFTNRAEFSKENKYNSRYQSEGIKRTKKPAKAVREAKK